MFRLKLEVGEGCFVQVVVSGGMTVVPVKHDLEIGAGMGLAADEVDETTRRRT